MKPNLILGKGGIGDTQKSFGYTTAVKIGNIVKISGQGGWDESGVNFPHKDIKDEIIQACDNVEWALNSAGASWKDVYSVTSYFTVPFTDEIHMVLSSEFNKRCGKSPIWTQLGVRELGNKPMRVEIVVEAFVE
ncbi:Rid family hydrolase [Campylobacter corcagiensis]|uniref:RidA family protein n=1 Tax=Campylobacter corcagiensis TaxID=1448857 RepID=A0A7M1LGV8_9BACT|nr:Rid family hydrolase [Campylobacter corcagiensis]QKF63958.1 RidA/YjgF/YER057c/UK114 family protein [Campylobacter corcagiensis]QOQ87839.1 hypothetical protein IMC76_03285 [Campylobacter corcagiensis]